MARIASTVADLIGGTPLVRINHVAGDGVDVVAKVEAFNPASSVKDRIARSIIDAAEAAGALAPGGTIVEATSGNTGIALSMVGAARGYKVVIVMPASMSVERRAIVRAFGAELVLTDPKGGVSAAVAEAERIASERPGAIIASQFTNPANPAAHVAHTGEEIWADTDGQVDVFVAGVGTGGTISGVAKVLKEKNPNVRVIAVQPAESPLLTGGTPGPHGIQGLMPRHSSSLAARPRKRACSWAFPRALPWLVRRPSPPVPSWPARRSSRSCPTRVSVTSRPRCSPASRTDLPQFTR